MKLSSKMFLRILALSAVFITAGLSGCNNNSDTDSSADPLDQVREYLAQGKTRLALINLKKFIQNEPESADARLMLATVYLKQSEPASAEIEIRKSIKYGTERKRWLPILGQALLTQSFFNKLLDEIKPELDDDNQTLSIVSQLQADAYLGKRNYIKANQLFLEAQAHDSQRLEPLLGLARVAILQKDISLSLDYLDEILARDPNQISALLLKGDIYLKYGRVDEAYSVINQALALTPNNPLALLKRAAIELSRANIKAAENDLQLVIKQYPGLPLANYLDARIYFLKGDIDKAHDALQQVFRIDPNFLPAHLLNGFVSLLKSSDRQAERSFRVYMAAKPDSRILIKLLAITQLRLGTPGQVVKMLTDKKNRRLLDQETRILLGLAYVYMDKFDEAKQVLRIAALQKSILIDYKQTDETSPEEPVSSNNEAYDKNILTRDRQVYKELLEGVVDDGARALIKHGAVKADNYYLAGLLMFANNKSEKAQQYFLEAIDRDPQQHDADIAQARLLMTKKQWPEAEKILLGIPGNSKQNNEAQILLVKLYESSGDIEKAVKQLDKAWRSNKKSIALGVSVFQYYIQQKKYKQADKTADELILAFPNKNILLRNIALIYRKAGFNDKAIKVMARVGKDDILSQLVLARMYAEEGKPEQAEIIYKTLIGKYPENILILQSLSQFYIKQNDLKRAMLVVDKIVILHPENPGAHQLKGWLAMQLGDSKTGLKSYKRAYDLKPGATLTIVYAKILVQNNMQDEARNLLRNWLFNNPQDHTARLMLASIYQQDQDKVKAIEEYKKLEQSGVSNLVVLNNLTWLLWETGDEELKVYLKKLVDINTKNPGVLDTIGWIYLQTGQPDKAEPFLKEAAAKLKTAPSVQYHLAAYHQKTGNTDAAKKILTSILSGNAPFPEKEDAQRLLDNL